MCGRIGTSVGVNLMSVLLFDYCDLMIAICCGILLITTIGTYFILRRTAAAVTAASKILNGPD